MMGKQLQLDKIFVENLVKDIEKQSKSYMTLKTLQAKMNKDRRSITEYYVSVNNLVKFYFALEALELKKNKNVNLYFTENRMMGIFTDYVIKEFLKKEFNFDTDVLLTLPLDNSEKISVVGRVDAVKFISDIAILIEIKFKKNIDKSKILKEKYERYRAQLDIYEYILKQTFNVKKVFRYIIYSNLQDLVVVECNEKFFDDIELSNFLKSVKYSIKEEIERGDDE